MPNDRSYVGRDAGIYFLKPASTILLSECVSLTKQGYRFCSVRVDGHIYIFMLKSDNKVARGMGSAFRTWSKC